MKKLSYIFVAFVTAFFVLNAVTLHAQTVIESWDFEGNSIGDSFDAIGWSPSDIQATVADDPVTSGNNVLEDSIHNYNAAPVLMFVLPEGKTLADYSTFTFKAYFAQGDVGFKDIVVEAYQTMPTAQAFNNEDVRIGSWNRAQLGSSDWEDITIDITNSSSFNDTIYIAFGINCAGTGDVGGTGVTTVWYADDVELVAGPTGPALVTQWGFLGGRIGDWQFSQSGDTASVGGDAQATSAWVALRGGFDAPITATTEEALVVTGKIEFVGSGIDTWSGLRYGLFQHDSAGTLITSPVDSTRWSGREDNSHGYLFTPISGTNATTDNNTQFVRVSGNWISTSTGSGPIYAAGLSRQKPRQAVATEGVYSFAFSVQPLEDGTKEVRFYLIKGEVENSAESEYFFGDSFIDTTTIDPTFNGVVFAVHTNEGSGSLPDLRQVLVSEVTVDVGSPITVPEAPWQAYYLDQWGITADAFGAGWPILNDSDYVVGDASIGGYRPQNDGSNGASLRGGFGQEVAIPTDQAVIVKGQMEFVGGDPGSVYTALRFAITFQDSITLQDQYTDSAKWVAPAGIGHYGYEVTPRSGTTDYPNGAGGAGPLWTVVNGNWASTFSNGGAPFGPMIQPAPRNAAILEGTYDWAISVQQVNDTTNEVRWIVFSEDETSYWFCGIVQAPVVTDKFNSILFWTREGEHTQFNIIAAQIDLGDPIEIPAAPFEAYFVDTWGFIGDPSNRIGGWQLTPGEVVGNVSISGDAPVPADQWSAIRGGFSDFITSPERPLKITGTVEFVDGGFEAWSSLRFGVFYSDSAGSVDSTEEYGYMWNGTENYHSGYLFMPHSGTNDIPTWSGPGTTGTWGAVVDAAWISTNGANNYILGSELQEPTDAAGTAGEYDFNISVTPQGDGTTLVKANLIKDDGSYAWVVETIDDNDPLATDKFNSIAFAVGSGNTTTAMHLIDVQVDSGTITGVDDPENLIPSQYTLNQNYPNPFNPTTTIEFALPKTGDASLVVYDILGRKVAELLKGNLNAGYHKINFNASNLASGVYFYRLEAGDFVSVKKLMLLK